MIINQAIFYQTTVVIRIQTQIKIKQFKFKIECQLSNLSDLHVYIIPDARLSGTQYVSYWPNTQSQG